MPIEKEVSGYYLPTTSIFDIGILQELDVNSEDFKELLVRLYQHINKMNLAINAKTNGLYLQEELVTGNTFFGTTSLSQDDLRPEYMTVFNFGALGIGANSIPHNFTFGADWNMTHIYGVASDATLGNFYPLPWTGAAGAYIDLHIDALNIVINNNSGLTFPVCTVVLKYLKQ